MVMFDEKVRDRHLKFDLQIEDSIPDFLMIDATRIRQILTNLIGNAIKFTEFGEVTISVSYDGSLLKISVEDTGIGMDAKQLDKLFQPFYQGDDSITRRYGGTGLGLSISKQLASKMQGDLLAYSTFGEGSRFVLKIPAEKSRTQEYVCYTDVNAPVSLPGYRVLVVEDNGLNQELIREVLAELELEVDIANNGKEALQAIETKPYDIILMDVQMPQMDGIQATKAIRQLGINTPIVAMTANAFEEDKRRCLNAGMNDYLSKPIHFDQVTRALQQWLKAGS